MFPMFEEPYQFQEQHEMDTTYTIQLDAHKLSFALPPENIKAVKGPDIT